MPTLFDALSAKLSGDDQEAQPIAGQQQQLTQALQAKSGKGTTATGTPAASNTTEQAAIAQGQAQLAQGAGAAKIAGAQVQQAASAEQASASTAAENLKTSAKIGQQNLATQAATSAAQTAGTEQQATAQTQANESLKITAINAEADKQARALASDKQISLDNIFRQFKSSQQDLAFREDASQLEHVGRVLALRDKSYVDELTRIGQERGLDDELNFKEESDRLGLGAQLDQLDTQLKFKTALNANQREWDTYLASMNADSAQMIAQAVIRDSAQNEMFSGAGTAVKGGIDAYAKTGSNDDTPKPGSDEAIDAQFTDNGKGESGNIDNGEIVSGKGSASYDATNDNTGNS